jgi:hypothetical protein
MLRVEPHERPSTSSLLGYGFTKLVITEVMHKYSDNNTNNNNNNNSNTNSKSKSNV